MPYINIKLAQKLTSEELDNLKKGLGEAVCLLPGKNESALMVDIEHGKTMYYGGTLRESCAYIDVRMYGDPEFDIKAEFTRTVFDLFNKTLGVKDEEMFLTITGFSNWGAFGRFI